MAKNDPPRPGAPPRPGTGRPRPGAAQRPSAPNRPTTGAPARGGASWSPPDSGAQPAPKIPANTPPTARDLDMVPLQESDAETGTDEGNKSATSFFALPTPKRKAPEPEPEPAPPPAAPPGPPPGAPMMGMPGMGPPGMGPPPGAMPPMMGGIGIQGPVAGGPAMGQPGMGYPTAPTLLPPDPEQDRARSYRVFAVIAGLMLMVCTAVVLMAGATVAAIMLQEDQAPETVAVTRPEPAPRRPVVDTGVKEPPAPVPVKPSPRPSGGPSPAPAPAAPAPAPAPPPAPVGPAAATIKISPSEPFTGVEVTCALSGFRQRASFTAGVATIPDVPVEECAVIFKGGPPAKNTIRGGQTKECTFSAGTAVCN